MSYLIAFENTHDIILSLALGFLLPILVVVWEPNAQRQLILGLETWKVESLANGQRRGLESTLLPCPLWAPRQGPSLADLHQVQRQERSPLLDSEEGSAHSRVAGHPSLKFHPRRFWLARVRCPLPPEAAGSPPLPRWRPWARPEEARVHRPGAGSLLKAQLRPFRSDHSGAATPLSAQEG